MGYRSSQRKSAPTGEIEIKQFLKRKFMEFDVNNDKRLSVEEVASAFDALGSLLPGWRAKAGMLRADNNDDGKIDSKELAALIDYVYKLGFNINNISSR